MLNIEIEVTAIFVAVSSSTCNVNVGLIAGIDGKISAVGFLVFYGMGVGQANNLGKYTQYLVIHLQHSKSAACKPSEYHQQTHIEAGRALLDNFLRVQNQILQTKKHISEYRNFNNHAMT